MTTNDRRFIYHCAVGVACAIVTTGLGPGLAWAVWVFLAVVSFASAWMLTGR